MKEKHLLTFYPRVTEKIKEWYTYKVISVEKDETTANNLLKIPHMPSIIERSMYNSVESRPSMLFELFDALKIYVGITIDFKDETETPLFNYYICPKGKCLDIERQDYTNRPTAEYFAVMEVLQYIDVNFDEIYPKN